MGRHERSNEPSLTCPSIDDAQKELRDIADSLEALRKDNEQLRAWGMDWFDKAEEFEQERNDARDELRDVTNERDDLARQVESLERKVENLELRLERELTH